MKRLVVALAVLTAFQMSQAQTRPAVLDDWTGHLGQNPAATVTSLADVPGLIARFQLPQDLLEQLVKEVEEVRLTTLADYHKLAGQLMNARQLLRFRTDINLAFKRDALYLLEQLAEETLYAASVRFPLLGPEFVYVGDAGPITTPRAARLRLFDVQTGDVLLSKATGSGSSTFIALSMNHPHIYSHSTPVYVEPRTLKPLSPEAFIEDGLKLRDLTEDYIKGSKTRLAIYRFEGLTPLQRNQIHAEVTVRMDRFVKNLFQLTDGDPANKAAFPYDFGMDPIKAAGKKFFCSGVAYEVYPYPTDLRNPYPQGLWSFATGGRENIFRMLGIQTARIPAPGDLELNTLYKLVGFRVDVFRLRQERIENAIIDSFLAWIESNPALSMDLRRKLEPIGNRPLRQDDVQRLISIGLVPEEMRATLLEKVGQMPDDVNVKQLVFFYSMNELITPKLRDTMMSLVLQAERRGSLPGPLELRRMSATLATQMWARQIASLQQKLALLNAPAR